MKVYISGPITGHQDYMKQFDHAERLLRLHGYETINPARENDRMPEGTTWEQYMARCWKLIRPAEAIYLMDGWNTSRGACMELTWAEHMGIRIMTEQMVNSEINYKTHDRLDTMEALE